MRMWFNGSRGNPNERTAQLKIRELIKNSAQFLQSSLLVLIICATLTDAV